MDKKTEQILDICSRKLENVSFYGDKIGFFCQYFNDCKNVLVLDATYGTFVELLNQQNIGCLGVETSDYFISEAAKNNIDLLKTDSYLNFLQENEKKFDGVFIPFLLEKFTDGEKAVEFLLKINYCLKNQAKIVLLFDNFANSTVQEEVFWQNISNQRPYSYKILYSFLLEMGFSIESNNISPESLEHFFVMTKISSIDPKITAGKFIQKNEQLFIEEDDKKNYYRRFVNFYSNQAKVLDIGCQKGIFLELLRENNLEGIGIDINEDSIAECKKKELNAFCLNYQEYFTKFSEPVDGIFCAHLIEHFDTKEGLEFLYLCSKAIKDGGVAIFITPNFASQQVNQELFWLDFTHKRPYHVQIIAEIMQVFGFEPMVMSLEANNLDMFIALRKRKEPLIPEANFSEKNEYLNHIFALISHKFEGEYEYRYEYQKKYFKFFDICNKVLVLPCSDGPFVEFLKKNDIEVKGIDTYNYSVQKAQERGLDVINTDPFDFLKKNPNTYDGIFSPHYVDHLSSEKTIEFIQSCYESLQENGNLVLLMPNFAHFGVRQAMFWGDISHTRPYSPLVIEKILTISGFRVITKGTEAGGLDHYIVAYKPSRLFSLE